MKELTPADRLIQTLEFVDVDGDRLPDELLRGKWEVVGAPAGEPVKPGDRGSFRLDHGVVFFEVDGSGALLLDGIGEVEVGPGAAFVETGRGHFGFARA